MKWHQSAGVCVHLFVSTEAHTEKAVWAAGITKLQQSI